MDASAWLRQLCHRCVGRIVVRPYPTSGFAEDAGDISRRIGVTVGREMPQMCMAMQKRRYQFATMGDSMHPLCSKEPSLGLLGETR